MFIDKVKISIKAGDGGDGATSFLHFKGVVNGGPDGGDGGKGGNVIIRADKHLSSLVEYYYKTKYFAGNGERGMSKNCTGKAGEDVVLLVPLGTVVKDEKTGNVIQDFFYHGQEKVVLEGGQGGKGNARFVTSRRHAPHFSQKGEPTEKQSIIMELKTIADVGLIGFPNVGKSTLLSKVSSARPKIANYHFTTLSPNLGVVSRFDESFVVADIPGLIEGASEGAGLGIEFLKHIERTRMLVHVVDISGMEGRDPYDDFIKINAELKGYSETLASLQQIVVANKCDVFGAEENLEVFTQKIKEDFGDKYKVIPITAITGDGKEKLLDEIQKVLKDLPPVSPLEFEEFNYTKPDRLDYEIEEIEDGVFNITGSLIDVLVRNVCMSDMHSMAYLQKVLKDRGIFKQLRQMGAGEGSTIIIAGTEFDFVD